MAVVVGVAVVSAVVAGALVWINVLKPESGPQASTSTGSSTAPGTLAPSESATHTHDTPAGSPPAAPTGGAARSGADASAACAAEVLAADAVVAAARIGIGHWAEHIRARTDLLSGAQPEAVTKAIWKRTREAGPADLARYQQAIAERARRTGGCSAAKSRDAATPDLTSCRKRLEALAPVIAAGAAGMHDWQAHQKAMAAHKAGEIDAAHAQHLWVAAWAAAPKNISAFHSAETALRNAPACRD